MKTPATSKLFTPWKNPTSGAVSYILSERPASVQKQSYFTNPTFSNDGRFLWVICMFVPSGGRLATPVLGLVDFEADEFRIYHETQHNNHPTIDFETGEAYWINGRDLYKRGPLAGDQAVKVNSLRPEMLKGQMLDRVASHLFFSADKKSLLMDAHIGTETHLGIIPLDGSAPEIWHTSEKYFNHAQFSPTDSELMLFAHEFWKDNKPFDGQRKYHRVWMMRKGGQPEPVLKEPVTHSGHEWWDAGGDHIWYVHYGVGIKKVDLATRTEVMKWPGHLSHGYSDKAGRYVVADMMADPVVSDCHVSLRDTETGKEVELVNRPPLDPTLTQCGHLHPHPHFCQQDNYVCYTTTIHDRVDLALARTEDLVALLK